MILYLDTSAIVKLFVDEHRSPGVRAAVIQAAVVNTHLIGFAETCATFARIGRERKDPAFCSKARPAFEQIWGYWRIVTVDETMIRRAGDLAEQFCLRGYDSVHLAAAEAVWRAAPGVDFRVAVFDGGLAKATQQLGMTLLN